MRVIKILGAVVALTIGLSGCYLFWVTHTNVETGYSVSIPRSWEKKEKRLPVGYILMVRIPPKGGEGTFSPNITVTSTLLSNPADLDMIFDANKRIIMDRVPGAKYDIAEGETYNFGVKGKWLMYTFKNERYEIRSKTMAWLKGTAMYSMTTSCQVSEYPRYKRIFEKAQNSFKILK